MLKVLNDQIEELKQRFPEAQVTPNPDGSYFIQLDGFPLPPGWSKHDVTLMLVVPIGYPHTRPNGFEVDAELRLANGNVPSGYSQVNYGGKPWLHLCWQPGQPWITEKDGLWKHIAFAELRLQQLV